MPRASWKGFIKIAELAFPVALYAGASQSDRVAFHIVNRKTGHRVRRQYVDEETQKPVEAEQQVKGYEIGDDQYVVVEPDEIAEAYPVSDKTIQIEAFIPCADVETVYFDRPYFIAPDKDVLGESFAVFREGMRRKGMAALGRAVLFRRLRSLLLRPHDRGLVANTLKFGYEVRTADTVFDDLPQVKVEGEMLALARHIIKTKEGKFDPRKFDDRYDAALAELVKAKMEGREIEIPEPPKPTKVVDLMDALRRSAGAAAEKPPAASKRKKKPAAAAPRRRKAS